MVKGYECDICGDFNPGEPDFKVRPKDDPRLMRGGKSVADVWRYDICGTCWGDKIQQAIWNARGAKRIEGED